MRERTIKLVLEYDGSELSGWQRQANAITVQEHLERALATLLREPVGVTGASRTDAGVHALGQVAAFRTSATIAAHGIRRGLNSQLPPSIAIIAASEAPAAFHPRLWARGKRYSYRILNRADRSPLLRKRAWHRPLPLNLEAMRVASKALEGEHDFAAFRATGCTARTTRRHIDSIAIERRQQHVLEIAVVGNAFLRNMVRIIAGTLVDVGQGRMSAEALAAVLASGDRTLAGQTAPAHGLTLMEVFYSEPLAPRPPLLAGETSRSVV